MEEFLTSGFSTTGTETRISATVDGVGSLFLPRSLAFPCAADAWLSVTEIIKLEKKKKRKKKKKNDNNNYINKYYYYHHHHH